MAGSVAFKGPPKNGVVEIAYGTFEPYRQRGIGTEICRLHPSIKITSITSKKFLGQKF